MFSVPPRQLLILLVLLAASLSAVALQDHHENSVHRSTVDEKPLQPAVVLWAWERPEDLTFINPQKTAVAYLAKTVFLRRGRVVAKPRLQPLSLPAGTTVIPVARIEADDKDASALTDEDAKKVVAEISQLALLPNVSMIQVDFDATTSQREFYRHLLIKLRNTLPPATKLSITALASWCQGDNWLADLPIDEAVPMLFRMGIDRKAILSRLAGEGFQATRCESSAGISLDENINNLPPVSRLYVFNPSGWDHAAVNKVMETYQR
jgi:hypothetical protein